MATLSLATAENALKTFYLDVVAHQLNSETNPLYNKMKQSENHVYGNEVRKAASYGINGGISAGTETGDLPTPASENYVQFTAGLKNLYGQLEISDKAIRASQDTTGAFVNLLNAEMEGLLRAAKFNFGRMLYGNGSGVLATLTAAATDSDTLTVDATRNLQEGMTVDLFTTAADSTAAEAGLRVIGVNRTASTVTLNTAVSLASGGVITLQGSKGRELTGLGAIFASSGTLYGLDRSQNPWMVPYMATSVGSISDSKIQLALDTCEERAGSRADIALCSFGVRRAYANYLETTKRNVNTVELEGGFRALSYAGLPLVADRFVPAGTLFLLDSEDFTLHQLCDWHFLEGENGNILRQISGRPVYNATLVKYAELMCHKPGGQAKLSGITEA